MTGDSRATRLHFHESARLAAELERLVPGGGHTYAKGPDQFPEGMAPIVVRGLGAHVWDADGNELIEYGSGLRSVALGHAHPEVVARVTEALASGTNYARPSLLELQAARSILDLVPGGEQIKFTKNGSDATTAAVRLARAVTGRPLIAIASDQPFFSVDDWFIATTAMSAGIPSSIGALTIGFPYGDPAALEALFAQHPGQICGVIMQATTAVDPPDGYLEAAQSACMRDGALFILDEMITGFRWDSGGAQTLYGITPDLSTFGKAMGNGFAVSALLGKREFMERGGLNTVEDRVFLLSTTHGAESVGLAAACAVATIYQREPIIAHLHDLGHQLSDAVSDVIEDAGLSDHIQLSGRASNLVFITRDQDERPSQEFRTLFMQEMLMRGILAPSFVVSAALTENDIARTAEAVAGATKAYARGLEAGPAGILRGRPVKPALRSRT